MFSTYNVIKADQIIEVHKDENSSIVIDDIEFEVEDLETEQHYKINAYSLQDGSDYIRIDFYLWNTENECYENVGFEFYKPDGRKVTDRVGADVEDAELQEKVEESIFDYTIPTLSTVKDLKDYLQDYIIDFR